MKIQFNRIHQSKLNEHKRARTNKKSGRRPIKISFRNITYSNTTKRNREIWWKIRKAFHCFSRSLVIAQRNGFVHAYEAALSLTLTRLLTYIRLNSNSEIWTTKNVIVNLYDEITSNIKIFYHIESLFANYFCRFFAPSTTITQRLPTSEGMFRGNLKCFMSLFALKSFLFIFPSLPIWRGASFENCNLISDASQPNLHIKTIKFDK